MLNKYQISLLKGCQRRLNLKIIACTKMTKFWRLDIEDNQDKFRYELLPEMKLILYQFENGEYRIVNIKNNALSPQSIRRLLELAHDCAVILYQQPKL